MSVKKGDKAKEKDKKGKYARIGMETMCANWFNIKDSNSVCVKAIVDDYLENINEDFFMWIRCGKPTHCPMILKRNYSDLFMVSDDLHVIADLFLHLYGQKFLVDEYADCIYTTEFKINNDMGRKRKLNYVGIMELERLISLHERKILTWEDIDESVELLKKYGYDIDDDCYRSDDLYETASNIEERLDLIFKIEDSNIE